MATEMNMHTKRDEYKSRKRIEAKYYTAKQEISSLITHEKIGLQRSNPTFIFPPSSVSVERIAGFVLFQYYKQYALESNKTF